MRFGIFFTTIFLCSQLAISQVIMPDFQVTDTHAKTHKLYADYLNKGKVVVIKFFFTTCPPCIENAPLWQKKYVEFGSGAKDVEFFSMTTLLSDSDAKVTSFENTYFQTMKGISQDGGASAVVDQFKIGKFGSWWGTPSFAVIAPDKTINYPIFFTQLDDAINKAKTSVTTAKPMVINLNVSKSADLNIGDGHVRFFIKSENTTTPKYEIIKNSDGQYTFSYPSANFPEIPNPEVVMESFASAYTSNVSALDVVYIQRHILGLTELTQPEKLLAADVNSDGKITVHDLLATRKVILGIIYDFPNNTPSYKAIPATIPIALNPGAVLPVNFTIVKMGNVY